MRAYSFDLESFAEKHLGGDIRNLAELSFTTMRVVPQQYDFALTDCIDCDDTNLAWEVYNRVWGLERMPESPPLDVGMAQPEWRGDTMNSFRTLFGHEIIPEDICVVGGDGVVGFKGLRRFGVEKELFEKVHEFWYTYHSIGNFIPLPNAKACGKTINTYRTVWHDYFDAFLENLHACLTRNVPVDEEAGPSLPKLIAANSFFWDRYRGEDGWERYVREYVLESYCDEYMRPKKLYAGLWHWQRNVSRTDYVKACNEYMDSATERILARGRKIMAAVVEGRDLSGETAEGRGVGAMGSRSKTWEMFVTRFCPGADVDGENWRTFVSSVIHGKSEDQFTSSDWRTIQRTMRRYINPEGMIVDPSPFCVWYAESEGFRAE